MIEIDLQVIILLLYYGMMASTIINVASIFIKVLSRNLNNKKSSRKLQVL